MLEFWDDGGKVECKPLGNRARAGQVVIMDHVQWDDPNLEQYPLALYPCPSIFTITEKTADRNPGFMLMDGQNNLIWIPGDRAWKTMSHLYDAAEWSAWIKAYAAHKLAAKNRKIEQLLSQTDLLKEILVRQGIHIVTQEKAKELGIA